MPSYDLVCQECGYKFSVFCSISKKEQQLCSECGSDKIVQRFTTVNIGGSKSGGGSCNLGSCNSSGFG